MIFNNVTCAIRKWCRSASRRYHTEAMAEQTETGDTNRFSMMWFADEMAYKIGSLLDREFTGFEEFREAVRALVPERISYVLTHERDPGALALTAEAEAEFLQFLGDLGEDVSAEPEPYYRVIMGAEREELGYAILEKWDYSTAYWYPLQGAFDGSKLFLDAERLEPYLDRLCRLLGLPQERVYEYGESVFGDPHCAEVDDLYGYCGNEAAYLPKDLSWIIYFSHESTVTFAGTIVPAVRELLEAEREYWNTYD